MAAVVCQRPGHARSKVVRDGRYGTPGHKRQQYRCTPSNGDPSHRFTPVLPRLCVHGGERCLDCEHVIDRDEGPQVPRTYWYSSRDIAESLRAVGTGVSYTEAADSCAQASATHVAQTAPPRSARGRLDRGVRARALGVVPANEASRAPNL